MAKELLNPEQEQITKGEQFLLDLYQEIEQVAKEKGLDKVFEAQDEQVDHWSSIGSRHGTETPLTVSLNLQKASVFTNKKLTLALSLGSGTKTRYDDGKLTRLQFGGLYDHFEFAGLTPQESLQKTRTLVSHHAFGSTYLFGEFDYHHHTGQLEVDCWVDSTNLYGGEGVNLWPTEKITTHEGLKKCVEIIKRTIDRGK